MKNNKGITLIALVVTIIVLLILAAVSIAMLTGENGILTNATKSKALNEAINLCANIQSMNFNEASAKDIVKLYDEVTEKSKMAIASGASRHDNEINEKNSKKYIKKNYKI